MCQCIGLINVSHACAPTNTGCTCLGYAAEAGCIESVKLLVDFEPGLLVGHQDTPPVGDTPLIVATKHQHKNLAFYMLDRGADAAGRDVRGRTALHWAAVAPSTPMLPMLLDGCR